MRPRLALTLAMLAGFALGAVAVQSVHAQRTGPGAYAIIRDPPCRLFGYHGLLGRDGAFSLDHMFGF